MRIHFDADDVRLDAARDSTGNLVPVLAGARNGAVLVSLAKAELDAAVLAFARAGASEHGVKVEAADLTLTAHGDRSIAATVRVRGKKSFIPATVVVSGQADVDDALTLTVSGLTCQGEGPVGSVVAGLLAPKLQTYNGRRFPLAGESLRNLKVKALSLDVQDGLRIDAAFES